MSVTVLTPADSRRLCEVMQALDEMPEPVILVERFIDQASAAIERYCGRIFAQQRYREVRGPWLWSDHLVLRHSPVISVSLVSADGQAITDYRIEDAEAGILYRRDGWGRWGGEEWTFEYVAGFFLPEQSTPTDAAQIDLPGDIQRACIETTKIWWQEREILDRIASKTLGLTGDRVDYRVSAHREHLPVLARYSLDRWRRSLVA
jgi:hypothetical protein